MITFEKTEFKGWYSIILNNKTRWFYKFKEAKDFLDAVMRTLDYNEEDELKKEKEFFEIMKPTITEWNP